MRVPAPRPAAHPNISGPGVSDLVDVLKSRAPRTATALAASRAAWPAARSAREWWSDRTTYTVKVNGADDIYDDVHAWLLRLLPARDQRAVVAWTTRPGVSHALYQAAPLLGAGREKREAPPELRLRYDGSRQQAVTIAGHRFAVSVTDGDNPDRSSRRWRPPEIVFSCRSQNARDALLRELGGLVRAAHGRERRPMFRMLTQWGEWDRLDDLPPRPLESVVLAAGQMERLTADVGRWLAAEPEYARRSVPWHRAYLLWGPPGTGKTSVPRALACHFGLDLWYMPLGDVEKDGDLLRALTRIGPGALLLLEDIDVFHAATSRDDDGKGVTLAGLLNALDGVATPHGLLTFLTSNRPDVLEAAMVREGRVDVTEHLDLAGPDEVARLLSRWYGRPALVPPDLPPVPPSAVQEACKRHDTMDAAIAGLAAAGQRRVLVTHGT